MSGTSAAFISRLTVFVRDLVVEAGIGVHDHEQGRLQTLVINVTLELAPGPVEQLSDTLNYEAVARLSRELVAEGHIGLVETFAQRLGQRLMADPVVHSVTVRIGKPGCLADAAEAGCEIRLLRG